jgi:uncharacterized protein
MSATDRHNIIRAATSAAQLEFVSAIACRRRPQGRACPGTIAVQRVEQPTAQISWKCTGCGDSGVIVGFEGGPDDLRQVAIEGTTARKRRKLRVSVQEYGSWISGELVSYDSIDRRTLYSAIYSKGNIALSASVDELDTLLDALAADIHHEKRPTRRRTLEWIYDEIHDKLPASRHNAVVPSPELPADPTSAYGHGFLSAVVAGPMVMPSAWLQRFLAMQLSIDDLNAAAARVMGAHNEVAQQLVERRESFGEITLRLAKSDQTGGELIEWQRGFCDAMDLNTDGWTQFLGDAEHKTLLEPLIFIGDLANDPDRRDWLADRTLRQNLGRAVGVMTVRIWELYRDEVMKPLDFERETPARREPKVSRNAPCPCGSSKKYKRCCGAPLHSL